MITSNSIVFTYFCVELSEENYTFYSVKKCVFLIVSLEK
jgi:hypothetical protein